MKTIHILIIFGVFVASYPILMRTFIKDMELAVTTAIIFSVFPLFLIFAHAGGKLG